MKRARYGQKLGVCSSPAEAVGAGPPNSTPPVFIFFREESEQRTSLENVYESSPSSEKSSTYPRIRQSSENSLLYPRICQSLENSSSYPKRPSSVVFEESLPVVLKESYSKSRRQAAATAQPDGSVLEWRIEEVDAESKISITESKKLTF